MSQNSPPSRSRSYALVWAFVLLVFLCELTIGGGAALWYTSGATIVPGIRAMGVDLSGRTIAEASSALEKAWQAKTITVQAGTHTWTLPATKLGYQLDADRMAQLAHRVGRTPDSLLDLLRRGAPASIDPIWTLDPNVAVDTLRPLVAPLEAPPRDATVRISGTEVETTPSSVGQAVELATGVADLQRYAGQVLADGRLTLTIVPLQPQIVELSAAAEQARQLLSAGPVSVRLNDPVSDQKVAWQIAPEEIGSILTPQFDSSNPVTATWGVDEEKLKEILAQRTEALAPERYVNPQEALPLLASAIVRAAPTGQRSEVKLRVYHFPRQHTVKAGETLSSIANDYGIPYPWIQQANAGLGDLVFSGQTITIPSQDEMIPLPPVENKRIIVTMKDQKLQAFEDGKLKWYWTISTGIPSSPTSPGVFQVQGRDPNAYANSWDLWMPWFVGFYRPVPTSDFMNGFHGFPKRAGTQLLWTNSLGKPVTFGCVLTTTENAKLLYDWAEDGVIVEVRRD